MIESGKWLSATRLSFHFEPRCGLEASPSPAMVASLKRISEVCPEDLVVSRFLQKGPDTESEKDGDRTEVTAGKRRR